MDFTTWLRQWLERHPLKGPPDLDRARFTVEVMARVRRVSAPSQGWAPHKTRRSWLFMRLGLVAATAAAGIALIIGVTTHARRQLADHLVREAQLLAMIDESGVAIQEAQGDDNPDALAEEVELIDQLTVLAEVRPSDEGIEQTLQLLEQLDEDALDAATDDASDHTLIEELQHLDEQEIST